MPEEKSEKRCFIIMPITTPEPMWELYRDGKDHFAHVLECLFVPAAAKAGYDPIRPLAEGSDLIHAGIVENLETADLVLCDMSCLNANVFFEFGIRTSLNKPVCIVKDELTKKVPFDTGILNHHEYRETLEPWELSEEIQKLVEHIKAAAKRSKGDNTLWKYFGFRTKAKPYAGETGMDAKIDYLTMQIDSLRQQVGNIAQPSERNSVSRVTWEDEERDVIDQILERLPAGVAPTKLNGNLKTGYLVTYSGAFSSRRKEVLSRWFSGKYGVELRFIKHSIKEAEGDA